jgi:hypothetical protein
MTIAKSDTRDVESPKLSMEEHTRVDIPADANRRVRRLV